MQQHPYVATRSSTPPLLYRRAASVSGVYPPHLSTPDINSIRLSAAMPYSKPMQPSSVTYENLNVSNPFTGSSSDKFANLTGAHRWSVAEDSTRVSALETEEASLILEEAELKSKLAELRAERQSFDGKQINLSQGWATLFDREQRYHTEPIPDYSLDTMACEQRCSVLREQLNHAQNHLEGLHDQLKAFEPVMEEREKLAAQIAALTEGFKEFERRRAACVRQAGQLFDTESIRAVECEKAVKALDEDLRVLRHSDTLSRYFGANPHIEDGKPSRSLKNVTFAPEKSIVLDWTSNPNSMERSDPGMTSSSMDASGSPQGFALSGQDSFCVGFREDEGDDITGIGGASTVVSLNQSLDGPFPFMKRHRVEIAAPI